MEYGHGGDIYSQNIKMDFSANINPLGLPEGVREALYGAISQCQCYPDSRCRDLAEGLSLYHSLPKEWIICGNGGADLIFSLVFAQKPERAVLLAPTFSEYSQALKAAGCSITYFDLPPEKGFALDTDEFCSFLKEAGNLKGGMVFLCNPNNPTGLTIDRDAVRRIGQVCQEKGAVLAVDECFCQLTEEPEKISGISWLAENPRLFILKAFTKSYAMAGLRLGYGLCSDTELLEKINQVRQPWSVSILSQEAGKAALREGEYRERTRQLIPAEREFLKKGLKRLGFQVWDSKANYLFFFDKERENRELYHLLKESGVLIRCCDNYRGLTGQHYRICVKTREENQAFLESLETILSRKGKHRREI